MSQIHRAANILIDLQIPRYEGEGAHERPRSPGRGVRLRHVDGVFARGLEGEFQRALVVRGELVGRLKLLLLLLLVLGLVRGGLRRGGGERELGGEFEELGVEVVG